MDIIIFISIKIKIKVLGNEIDDINRDWCIKKMNRNLIDATKRGYCFGADYPIGIETVYSRKETPLIMAARYGHIE
ncbi:MAG: hypothetical protein KAR20_18845 [Candidatus Heimdallarchaeota archaeon]|nr:hypothetical protein [Candidatus Heimdallarchaeota archaeon]